MSARAAAALLLAIRLAATAATAAFAATAAAPAAARADTLDAIVRARVAPALPAGLGVARVHAPPALAGQELDPARVAVELPRVLAAGRRSVKVSVRGRPARYVAIAITRVAEVAIARRALAPGDVIGPGDVALEARALEGPAPAPVNSVVGATATRALPAGAPIGAADVALPPPLPRGAPVRVEIRRGSVIVRATGALELAARPGEAAAARLGATRALVRGTLVAPSTLVVAGE